MARFFLSLAVPFAVISLVSHAFTACWSRSFGPLLSVEITPREAFFGLICVWIASTVARGADIRIQVVNHE